MWFVMTKDENRTRVINYITNMEKKFKWKCLQ